jgi:TMEM175 potassium channel family protein
MSIATPPVHQYPKGRTEAFTDGVMAIVITLLVLELSVAAGSEEDLLQAILDQWPSYLAYFTSFFTVGAFWLRHHAITNAMRGVDAGFIRLNLLAIFFLSFLPFPTKLVAEYLNAENATRVAAVFYGLVLLLTAVSFRILWLHVARNRELLRADIGDERVEELSESLTPSLIAYVVAMLIGLALPHLAVALYFLVAVLIALPIGTLRAALQNKT